MAQFFWTQLSSEYFIQFLTRWVFVDLMDRQNGVLAYNVKNLRSFLKVIWLQRRYVPYRKMLQNVGGDVAPAGLLFVCNPPMQQQTK